MTLNNAAYFVGGAVLSAALMLGVSNNAATKNNPMSVAEYESRLDQAPVFLNETLAGQTKAYMKRSMRAHLDEDVAALIADLGDDYSFTRMYEEGPVVLAESREMAEEMSVTLYESDYMKNYMGVDSYPIAIIGNLGIQFDIETFAFDDGSKEVSKILTVYELKDGKLWRNWAFTPVDNVHGED